MFNYFSTGFASWFVKAKFHYAIWSQTCPKLVADLQLVLDERPNFCSLRPDSVMELGFYCTDVHRERSTKLCTMFGRLLGYS